jgi:hypothetical protein
LGSQIHLNLGPYAEPLRFFLIDAAPFPREMVLNITVSGLTNQCGPVSKEFPHENRHSPPSLYDPGNVFHPAGWKSNYDAERLTCAAHTSDGRIFIWKQTDRELLSGSMRKLLGLASRTRW